MSKEFYAKLLSDLERAGMINWENMENLTELNGMKQKDLVKILDELLCN